ncbi:MAG: hypothetical protein CMF41_06000 [Legionellales bacterium]|nr:hypothetical protein [Legionellales bacterium]OUX64265.1 MAG: hypothetical protein CBE41_03615 [Gammaproteobacteria bacterium TMED281]|tara:strand:+ start:835 stop:1347 length:513 start_codon:yes stop_codon:yes gene_type:complete
MYNVHEYKQELNDILKHYEQRSVDGKSKVNIHRIKDLRNIRSIISTENTIPILNLKLKDYLAVMKNKWDFWTFYLTQVSYSYLKSALLDFIHYQEKVLLLEDTLKTTSRLKKECETIVGDQREIIESLIEEHKKTLSHVVDKIEKNRFAKDVHCEIDENVYKQSIEFLIK